MSGSTRAVFPVCRKLVVPAQEAVLCGERRVEKLLLRRVASDRPGGRWRSRKGTRAQFKHSSVLICARTGTQSSISSSGKQAYYYSHWLVVKIKWDKTMKRKKTNPWTPKHAAVRVNCRHCGQGLALASPWLLCVVGGACHSVALIKHTGCAVLAAEPRWSAGSP